MTARNKALQKIGSDCLIGYTGFVGSSLLKQKSFSAYYNSKNIDKIHNQKYDTVVCAAAPGSMFEANNFPEKDLNQIDLLIGHLSGIRANRIILISSIATLSDFSAGLDESTKAFQHKTPYGRNRRRLEEFCEYHFPTCLIVRLPSLFGPGLRKNFIFDLMNPLPTIMNQARFDALSEKLTPHLQSLLSDLYSYDPVIGLLKIDRQVLNGDCRREELEFAVNKANFSAMQFHNAETTYQYYDMSLLWRDISIACDAGLNCIHLVNEPLKVARIHEQLAGRPMPVTNAPLHDENICTRHGDLWGVSGQYLETADHILERLTVFFSQESRRV